MDQLNIFSSEIIFGVCTLFMFYFAILDHSSLKSGNHNDSKSVIVSIGVLGTFIGIFLGLWQFDTQNISGSVPKLLEGLKLAFSTSIAGMGISIFLSLIQRKEITGGDDEISILTEMSTKLNQLTHLENLGKEISGLRAESRDEQIQMRSHIEVGFKKNHQLLSEIVTNDSIIQFRNEVHDEQLKARNFFESQFKKTNETLEKAIEILAEGATEEIIKALEKAMIDFNENLKETFGKDFEQLNKAVRKLLDWQENYKETVEKDYDLLVEIRKSMSTSKETFVEIASRNDDVMKVYNQLAQLIQTYDIELKSLNEQLGTYAALGEQATAAFSALERGFDKVEQGMSTQAESIAILTQDIEKKLPESLSELERTLSGLTEKFAADYQTFLDHYQDLIRKSR